MVLCFFKMPVNLSQYRVRVGIFSNRQIIISLYHEISLYLDMSNNLSNYGSSYSSLIFCFIFYILFLSKGNALIITTKFCAAFFLFHNFVASVLVCLSSLLLMLSGEVEINPGPLSNFKKYFWFCHWNVNSIYFHDYSKLLLLKAYAILHKFDIICLS